MVDVRPFYLKKGIILWFKHITEFVRIGKELGYHIYQVLIVLPLLSRET